MSAFAVHKLQVVVQTCTWEPATVSDRGSQWVPCPHVLATEPGRARYSSQQWRLFPPGPWLHQTKCFQLGKAHLQHGQHDWERDLHLGRPSSERRSRELDLPGNWHCQWRCAHTRNHVSKTIIFFFEFLVGTQIMTTLVFEVPDLAIHYTFHFTVTNLLRKFSIAL